MKFIAIAIAIGLAALALPAHAEDRAAAERYFRAGAKAYAAQNFSAAVANFDEAYKALPMPEIAFSAAQAYRRLYRVESRPHYVQRAVELYKVYLDHVKSGGRVGDAADSLGEMERELERLKARGASTKIEIVERTRLGVNLAIGDRAAETGALREIGDATGESLEGIAVSIDGKPVEPFAMVDVGEGDHVVAVSAEGYFPVEKTQRAIKGVSALVDIELRPRPAKVTVKTEGGVQISIDGRPQGSPALELAAGKHLLTIVRSGRRPFGREITVSRGQELVVEAPLEKTARRKAVPWVLGGAGVLALGAIAGTALAIVHDGRASELRDDLRAGNQAPGVGSAYDREVRARDDYRTAAWALGGAALAAGTVGILLYLNDTPAYERGPAAMQVAPVATSTTGGVSVRGRF